MKVTYESNNSGGEWWLKDEDWFALEEAGWKVGWHKDEKTSMLPAGNDGRFLGELAWCASKDFNSVTDAVREFELITGQDVMEEGCTCCGPPHIFEWQTEDGERDASGDELAIYLYGDFGALSKRAMLEKYKSGE